MSLCHINSCSLPDFCMAKPDTPVQFMPPLSIQIQQEIKQEVKVIWQKVPHGGPIPRLGVTPGGRKLYHWIPGVGFPISVP